MQHASELKLIIRANVRRLLGLRDGESGVSAVMALGFANGTAQRVLDDKTQIGVDKLGELAAALKVQPWQLCVPGLDPDRKPTLEPLQFRWPFHKIDPEVITGLTGTAAMQVENGLLAALAATGIAARVASSPASAEERRRAFQPPTPLESSLPAAGGRAARARART